MKKINKKTFNKKQKIALAICSSLGVIAIALMLIIGIQMKNTRDEQLAMQEAEEQVAIEAEKEAALEAENENEKPETTPIEEAEPVITEITISAAGDVTLGNAQIHGYGGTFIEMYDLQGPSYFFKNVADAFTNDDITIVNFEAVLTEFNDRVEKTFNLKGRPEFMQAMVDGSVEVAGFSNNHCRDYGEVSFTDTVSLFDQYGITYASDSKVGIYEVDGIKVGLVAVNALIGDYYMNYAIDGMSQLKELEADVKIVYVHWGIERDYYPMAQQEQWGHELVDMGYDLVLGSHPHVLQGIEIYKNTPIVYSLGNFCFGGNTNPAQKNTMIYQQTFKFINGTLVPTLDAKVIPCTISSVDSRNDYCPTIQTGTERGEQILEELRTYSKGWGTIIREDGTLD